MERASPEDLGRRHLREARQRRTFETPDDARFFHGADWGFANDPTALVRSFIQDECLFIDQEAFGYEVEIDETPQLFESIPTSRKWPIKADSSRPETISYMQRKGFNAACGEVAGKRPASGAQATTSRGAAGKI